MWQLHCRLELSNPPPIHIEERIASDRFYRFLERTWMWQQLPVALLFYAWGGWSFVVFGVCARITAGVFGHWLIGYFAHNHGPMNHEVRGAAVQGRNIPWTSLLTMGESWHNNHHAFPGSARLGLHAGEWDPGWWMLLALRRMGLVWSLRLAADLAPRPELVALPQPVKAGRFGFIDTVWTQLLHPTAQDQGALVWPAKRVGPQVMRRLLHGGTALSLDQNAARLVFATSDRVLFGLPALCVAVFRHRSLPARLMASLIMPIALSVESRRCPACGS